MRGLGYLVSIISVVLIGLVAWPGPEAPAWHVPALLLGMALSMMGMGLRWGASRQQKEEVRAVENRVGIAHPAE